MEIRSVPPRERVDDEGADLPAPVATVFDFTGRVLRGRYRLRRRVGSGGMGAVYEARDLQVGGAVAVKLLHPERSRDLEFRRRFLREARLGAELRHPHGVAVRDVGETDEGVPFLVMEHLEGRGLDEVARAGPLPWRRVCDLVLQLCGVLAAAHARGVVHRDIKPSNCFLVRTADGRDFVKLLDLGLAKLSAPHRGRGRVGTPEYMSPEQALGAPHDHRVDIYALGVTMVRLLTGKLPFTGDPPALLRRHIDEPPPPLSALAPDLEVPATIEAEVRRALAKDPAARHQSADELAAALRAARALAERGRLPTARRAPAPTSPRPLETARAALALGATGLTFAALAFSSVFYAGTPADAPPPAPLAPPPAPSAAPAAPARRPSAAQRPADPAPPADPPAAPPAPRPRPARVPTPDVPVLGALSPQTGSRILATIAPGVARCARAHGRGLLALELALEIEGALGTARAVELPAGVGDDLRRCVTELALRLRFPPARSGRLTHRYELPAGLRH